MSDIGKELLDIQTNRYGIDIRMPIHDALAALAGADAEIATRAANGFPIDFGNADISAELQVIQSDPKGANVKAAIYSALLKLSQVVGQTNYISAGLTPQEIEVEPLSGALLDKYHSLSTATPLSELATYLEDALLFGKVEYEAIGEDDGELRLYDQNDLTTPFVKITSELTGDPTCLDWWYRVHVYGYATADAAQKTVIYSFPEEAPTDATYATYPFIVPQGVYIGAGNARGAQKVVAIRLGEFVDCTGWMIFDRTDLSNLSVAFNCGNVLIPDDGYETIADISSKVRAFVSDSVATDIPYEYTIGKQEESQYLSLASLTALGKTDWNVFNRSYAALTPRLTKHHTGIVAFGTRKYFLTNSFMIEA